MSLTRRPRHLALGEQVNMEMRDGLAGVRAFVHKGTNAAIRIESEGEAVDG
jgi:hypothetical protein